MDICKCYFGESAIKLLNFIFILPDVGITSKVNLNLATFLTTRILIFLFIYLDSSRLLYLFIINLVVKFNSLMRFATFVQLCHFPLCRVSSERYHILDPLLRWI